MSLDGEIAHLDRHYAELKNGASEDVLALIYNSGKSHARSAAIYIKYGEGKYGPEIINKVAYLIATFCDLEETTQLFNDIGSTLIPKMGMLIAKSSTLYGGHECLPFLDEWSKYEGMEIYCEKLMESMGLLSS